MSEDTYVKFIFSIEGDVVKTKTEQNLEQTLPKLDPIPGVFIGTMLLALGVVVKNQSDVVAVIEKFGTKEDIEMAHNAIAAAYALIQIEKAKENIKETDEKEGGKEL